MKKKKKAKKKTIRKPRGVSRKKKAVKRGRGGQLARGTGKVRGSGRVKGQATKAEKLGGLLEAMASPASIKIIEHHIRMNPSGALGQLVVKLAVNSEIARTQRIDQHYEGRCPTCGYNPDDESTLIIPGVVGGRPATQAEYIAQLKSVDIDNPPHPPNRKKRLAMGQGK